MAEVQRRRPWWRRKRWQAVIALWLALPILYFVAEGPAAHAGRFSETAESLREFLYPEVLDEALAYWPVLADFRASYIGRWTDGVRLVRIYDVEVRWEPAKSPKGPAPLDIAPSDPAR